MDKNYTHEEILNALTVIKEVCKNHGCSTCPFQRGSRCGIELSEPSGWYLNFPDTPWKAFR